MKAPCKDCQDRVLKCHDSCEKYKAFKAERQIILDKQRQFNESWPLAHSIRKSKSLYKFNYHKREAEY